MLNQLPWHLWHVRWFPREDVAVSPEEVDERVFLFGVKACPDSSGLVAVACPKVKCLDQNLLVPLEGPIRRPERGGVNGSR
jgi:hypothetical protein